MSYAGAPKGFADALEWLHRLWPIINNNNNARFNITSLTEDTDPDPAADLLVAYDDSATVNKKIKISNLLFSATRFKVGNTTRDISTASGTQAITGVGFQPKAVIFLAVVNATTQASIGVDDGTNYGAVAANAGGVAGNFGPSTTASIVIVTGASDNAVGKITTLGSDGFTLTWTKTGSPTGTASILYLALR